MRIHSCSLGLSDAYSVGEYDVFMSADVIAKKLFTVDEFQRMGDVGILREEVADSSLRWDRTVKADLFAEKGIVEYWLLDINHETLIVYRNPKDGIYQTVTILGRGKTITPQEIPAVSFAIDDILGESIAS